MNKTQKSPLILVLLLSSFLFLSLISMSGIKPIQENVVINDQKIPLSAIPEGWKLNIIPLQIELTNWEFFMQDIKTGLGIPDAHVFLTCDAVGQHGTLSVYTDANGYAKMTVIKVDTATITATHPKYYQRSEPVNCRVSNMYIDWFLTPLTEPQPPNQTPPPIPSDVVKVTLYGQVDKKSYAIIGGLTIEGVQYDFDKRQPQRAVMWLKQNTIHTAYLSGWYNKAVPNWGGTGYDPVDFTYTIQITTTSEDVEYWVDLQSGDVHTGTPPTPEDDGGSWLWNFLMTYGMWIIAGAIILYALPHVASLAKTLKGK